MDYLGDLVDAAATDEELVSSPEFKEVQSRDVFQLDQPICSVCL